MGHMLDLSEDTLEDNIATCVEYLERMSKSNLLLEMEMGITGGEEDGVDNSDVDSSKLYTQPEEVWQVYEALSKVPNGKFTVAAAFGNVHGVYSPGNVRLEPQILHNTQKFISEKLGGDDKKPVYFVFHGGSGSSTWANEDYFAKNGEPLFSSHMLDLSEDPLEENIATCVEYLERMSKSNLLLEMELGITGGEEDGVDNSDVDSSKLYTQPEEVWQVYEALSKVPNGKFTVAAAFGNVHGVYSPGNVRLEPQILHNT